MIKNKYLASYWTVALTAIILLWVPLGAQSQLRELKIFNWSDYIAKTTLKDFSKQTGIKVIYDTYDASETVDARLLVGNSGYDLIIHAGSHMPRLIEAGIVQKIDTRKLKNYHKLDKQILRTMRNWDPKNQYLVPYMWGTTGMTYNMDMISKRMPNAPIGSLDIIFKPELIKQFADCGITILESQAEVIQMALSYLGLDPHTERKRDYDAVYKLFQPIRPYIRAFSSVNDLVALPAGELCIANNWSGNYALAQDNAAQANVDINLEYRIPETGSPLWIDVWTIPSDARNIEEAHQFIDYTLRPQVIADITNEVYYANANAEAGVLVREEIISDPAIYPPKELRSQLWTLRPLSPRMQRYRTRIWNKIKSGY